MMEYMTKFTELAHFADDYVATDMAKVRKFEDGLKLSIRGKIIGFLLQDMDFMVRTAMAIERKIEDAWSIRDAGASDKRQKGQPSSNSGKKLKASSSQGFRDRAAAIRAKAISRLLITTQIVLFHTLNTPGFEHFLRSNQPN